MAGSGPSLLDVLSHETGEAEQADGANEGAVKDDVDKHVEVEQIDEAADTALDDALDAALDAADASQSPPAADASEVVASAEGEKAGDASEASQRVEEAEMPQATEAAEASPRIKEVEMPQASEAQKTEAFEASQAASNEEPSSWADAMTDRLEQMMVDVSKKQPVKVSECDQEWQKFQMLAKAKQWQPGGDQAAYGILEVDRALREGSMAVLFLSERPEEGKQALDMTVEAASKTGARVFVARRGESDCYQAVDAWRAVASLKQRVPEPVEAEPWKRQVPEPVVYAASTEAAETPAKRPRLAAPAPAAGSQVAAGPVVLDQKFQWLPGKVKSWVEGLKGRLIALKAAPRNPAIQHGARRTSWGETWDKNDWRKEEKNDWEAKKEEKSSWGNDWKSSWNNDWKKKSWGDEADKENNWQSKSNKPVPPIADMMAAATSKAKPSAPPAGLASGSAGSQAPPPPAPATSSLAQAQQAQLAASLSQATGGLQWSQMAASPAAFQAAASQAAWAQWAAAAGPAAAAVAMNAYNQRAGMYPVTAVAPALAAPASNMQAFDAAALGARLLAGATGQPLGAETPAVAASAEAPATYAGAETPATASRQPKQVYAEIDIKTGCREFILELRDLAQVDKMKDPSVIPNLAREAREKYLPLVGALHLHSTLGDAFEKAKFASHRKSILFVLHEMLLGLRKSKQEPPPEDFFTTCLSLLERIGGRLRALDEKERATYKKLVQYWERKKVFQRPDDLKQIKTWWDVNEEL